MEIPIERRGDTLVVSVPGQLTVGNRQELKQKVLDHVERGAQRFLIDLRQTGYIDSSGLGVLVSVAKKIRERGGEITLANLNGELRSLFRLTKLDEQFALEGGWDEGEGAGRTAPLPPWRTGPPRGAAEEGRSDS